MGVSTTTVVDRLVDAMRDANWSAITDQYAPDVLLDMNLPTWRFQLQGREAAAQHLRDLTADLANLRLTSLRIHRGDPIVILEEEMRFELDDGEWLWRAVDVFHVDGDAVVEHVQYCTGCWSPEQIARQAQEAPMVRW